MNMRGGAPHPTIWDRIAEQATIARLNHFFTNVEVWLTARSPRLIEDDVHVGNKTEGGAMDTIEQDLKALVAERRGLGEQLRGEMPRPGWMAGATAKHIHPKGFRSEVSKYWPAHKIPDGRSHGGSVDGG